MRLAGALAALGLLSAQALAAVPLSPDMVGVWTGTIGTLPVSVCIGPQRKFGPVAGYYYHKTMRSIPLDLQDDGSWVEHGEGGTKETGKWQLAPSGAGRLGGTWSNGTRELPIVLSKATASPDDEFGPCGSTAYLAARIRPAMLTRKLTRLGPFGYTALSWDVGPGFADVSLESFEFPATRPGDAAINAALRLEPDKPDGKGEYLSCLQGSLALGASEGEFSLGYEPIHASLAFIGVKVTNAGFCGGAHPFWGYGYQTWDRQRGKEVRLAEWFTPQAFTRETFSGSADTYYKATPTLVRFLMQRMRFEDSECRSVVQQTEFWDVGLTQTGMIFTPSLPHVATPCLDDARVPFAQITPFLNARGKAALKRLGPVGVRK